MTSSKRRASATRKPSTGGTVSRNRSASRPKASSKRSSRTPASARSSSASSSPERTLSPFERSLLARIDRLSRQVASQQREISELRRDRLANPPSRPSSKRPRAVSLRTERVRREPRWNPRLHPRDAKGHFIPRAKPSRRLRQRPVAPPEPVPEPSIEKHYLVKVPVVLDTSTEDELEYANYNLWIVIAFDPTENEERFAELLRLYRYQLQHQDPHVRWLGDKWRVSETSLPEQAWTEDEPKKPRPS